MYNYSYHLLILIWAQAHIASTRFATVRLGHKDNINVRTSIDSMEKTGKYSPRTIGKLRRRQSSHENCLEGLPLVFLAVIAGNTCGQGAGWMNALAVGYFALRWLYIWLYITTTDQRVSLLRTITWYALNIWCVTTIWKAGNALNRTLL